MNIFKFTGAIALSVTLAGCGPLLTAPRAGSPGTVKAYVSDELIEKDADHTWEVTDQASFDAAASGINKAGENKKHIVTVNSSFAAKSPYSTTFYITVKKVVIVIEGNATISFSSSGTRTESILDVREEQAIILKDIKLQGNSSNSYPLVKVWNGGKFIMEGTASIQGNTARIKPSGRDGCQGFIDYPGGVAVNSGTFIMRGNSSVTGNSSVGGCPGGGKGGGVATASYPAPATFIMQDNASVTGNTAVSGGGVYANGGFTMQGNAKVSGNTASDRGGGIHGSVTMHDNAVVSGNTAPAGGGACGIFAGNEVVTMNDDAKVFDNTAQMGSDVCKVKPGFVLQCE
jgi:hypothetical protein